MNIRKKRFMLGVAAMVTAGLVTTVASQAAEQILSGTITSATGEKLPACGLLFGKLLGGRRPCRNRQRRGQERKRNA